MERTSVARGKGGTRKTIGETIKKDIEVNRLDKKLKTILLC